MFGWSANLGDFGACVRIFSGLRFSGEPLTQLSGSGCLLTIPLCRPLGGRGRQQLWQSLIHRRRRLSGCVWDNIRRQRTQKSILRRGISHILNISNHHYRKTTLISLSKCLDSVIGIFFIICRLHQQFFHRSSSSNSYSELAWASYYTYAHPIAFTGK